MKERKLASWLDGFEKYSEKTDSPELFRRWSGLFTIAAALERKVWIVTNKGRLFTTMYTLLVGPPGAGKGVVLEFVQQLLGKLTDHHTAPSSMTRASIIDSLVAATRNFMLPRASGVEHFNSLAVVSNEFGVFLPAYENDFMSVLTDMWDGKKYGETRRTNKINIEMTNPQLNILAGTTPSYLNNLLPEGAWDQGFMARTIPVYSGASAPGELFTTPDNDAGLWRVLIEDLKIIADLSGQMTFEQSAADFVLRWHKYSTSGGPPVPDHPKLAHYSTRRTSHLLKLCMLVAISKRNDLVILLEDAEEALSILAEVEEAIPDIFKAMRTGGDMTVIDETWHHLYKLFMKEQSPIVESRVLAFLAERTPAHNVIRILEIMEKTGMVRKEMIDHVGAAYRPTPRRVA